MVDFVFFADDWQPTTDNCSVCRSIHKFVIIRASSGSNSVVECDLAKVEVAGSNPVSRSRFSTLATGEGFLPGFPGFWYPGPARTAGFGLRGVEGRGRQVVRPRSAKPLSAVRFRPAPPDYATRIHGRLRSLTAFGISPAVSRFTHARKAAQVRFRPAPPKSVVRVLVLFL